MKPVERILCAAIYVDTGKRENDCQSYGYPETGVVFSGLRHNDCFTPLRLWWHELDPYNRKIIMRIHEHQHRGSRQGFLTTHGRFVDRKEAARIAYNTGQIHFQISSLTSEDIY
jgi:hypothetical protein